jgi:hypothetical protein
MDKMTSRRDASWLFRGVGYGVVLGAAASAWVPYVPLAFAGIVVAVFGQWLTVRSTLEGTTGPGC